MNNMLNSMVSDHMTTASFLASFLIKSHFLQFL